MASLTGTKIKDTYDSLIKVSDNGALDGTLQTLTDGLGNNSSLSLSTAGASVTGTLAVSGNATFDTTTLVVDASNDRVGIGEPSPSTKLYVKSSSFNVASFDSTFGQMAISFRNNGTTFSQIGSGISVTSTAAADDLGFGTAGLNKNIVFATGTGYTERMRILSSGGLTFNGDTSSANALDDYEEGTWTPTYSSSTGSFATMTMDTSTAKYTKIGNMVTILVYTKTDNVDVTGASGALYLSGLPFTVAGFGGGIALGVSNNFTNQIDGGYFVSGTTLIQLTKNGASTEAVVGDLSTGANNDHNNILFTATYFVS